MMRDGGNGARPTRNGGRAASAPGDARRSCVLGSQRERRSRIYPTSAEMISGSRLFRVGWKNDRDRDPGGGEGP